MNSRMTGALLLLLFVGSTGLVAQDQPVTSYDAPSQTWTLQNSSMRASFSLTPAGIFQFGSFSTADGSLSFVPAAKDQMSLISLTSDGSPVGDTTPWTLVETHQENARASGVKRVITLSNTPLNLQVQVNLEVHPGQPFFRYCLTVTNTGSAAHVLTSAKLMNWRWQTGQEMQAFSVHEYQSGTADFLNPSQVVLDQTDGGSVVFSGAHADYITWLALGYPGGNGLVAGWEFDGQATITATQANPTAPVVVSGGPNSLNLGINPGATVTLPAAFLGLYVGDWDEAGYRTQRYVEAVLAMPIPDNNFPYVAFDTWGYNTSFHAADLTQMATNAASMGVELFILDFGWSTGIGSTQSADWKFPTGGLPAFSNFVHSLGMKLGLHWTPAEAARNSSILTNNPDWAATEPSEYYGALPVCLGNTPTQNYAQAEISELVNDYQPDWITQDGENLVKQCTKTTHTHDPANSNWSNSVQGIDALVGWSHQQYPNLLWENNSDGGEMLTYNMVKNYVTAASCDACGEEMRVGAVYGMSYAFSPRYIDRYVTGAPNSFTMRTSEFGGPMILMEDITTWSDDDMALVAKEVSIYKSLRGLIRDGKVYHLGPAPSLSGNSAIESYNAAMDAAVVYAYRVQSDSDSLQVNPRGLRTDGFYTVTLQDAGISWSADGATLMAKGFSVPLPDFESSEIVYINPNSVTPPPPAKRRNRAR
jgi:alpha-galactosidase